MIKANIKKDVQEEIEAVSSVSSNHIYSDQQIESVKDLLNSIVPKEINSRSLVLVDTLINYYMDEITPEIDTLDADKQKAFYSQNLSSKIRAWAKETENSLKLNPEAVQYSNDPRNVYASKQSAFQFLAGSGITAIAWYFDPTKKISLIVGGLVTAAATAYIFKSSYEKAEPRARKQIEIDVKDYLNKAEKQMTDWLLKVSDEFEREFERFCNQHSISFDKKDNS